MTIVANQRRDALHAEAGRYRMARLTQAGANPVSRETDVSAGAGIALVLVLPVPAALQT
jgi:hypothetical protein